MRSLISFFIIVQFPLILEKYIIKDHVGIELMMNILSLRMKAISYIR